VPTIRKPKAWENGVYFSEAIITPEKRAQIVQAAAERAASFGQSKLQAAILENRDALEAGFLQAARRYVAFLNFDTLPSPSEVEARLQQIKSALSINWQEVERLIAVDDGAAYALREAVFKLRRPDSLEDLIDHRSGDFAEVLDRALGDIQAVKRRPGRRRETAWRTLILELAIAWKRATGELPGGGRVVPESEMPETRSGPFVDFAAGVVGALPNSEAIPDPVNPSLLIKKHLEFLRRAGAFENTHL
jgi:hypothetical protein